MSMTKARPRTRKLRLDSAYRGLGVGQREVQERELLCSVRVENGARMFDTTSVFGEQFELIGEDSDGLEIAVAVAAAAAVVGVKGHGWPDST
ncbi:hypothetical protein AC578_9864 [Pseudocercospora eumusae]|uniref:Uncharacterized protein n=1 Tax=Pseudocercospora eumusae TaxID=321146 RepID=A0A139HB42_9PEZI|nr:hypothetical protein AC578_9864 [Pseudocercospora eumusae]